MRRSRLGRGPGSCRVATTQRVATTRSWTRGVAATARPRPRSREPPKDDTIAASLGTSQRSRDLARPSAAPGVAALSSSQRAFVLTLRVRCSDCRHARTSARSSTIAERAGWRGCATFSLFLWLARSTAVDPPSTRRRPASGLASTPGVAASTQLWGSHRRRLRRGRVAAGAPRPATDDRGFAPLHGAPRRLFCGMFCHRGLVSVRRAWVV